MPPRLIADRFCAQDPWPSWWRKCADHSAEDLTFSIRLKTITEGNLRLENTCQSANIRQAARKFGTTLNFLPAGSEVPGECNVLFEISGNGASLVQALVEIQRGVPKQSMFWLDTSEKKQESLVIGPVPDGEALENIVRLSVRDLELSQGVLNALMNDNMVLVGDVAQRTPAEMKHIAGIGKVAIAAIQRALGQVGLELGTNIPGWPYGDIDSIALKFATERRPSMAIGEWVKRSERQASAIFADNWRGLSLRRPVAKLQTGAVFSFALVNYAYFQQETPAKLAEALVDKAIRKEFAARLAEWKVSGDFEVLEIGETLGSVGLSNFARAGRMLRPFIAVSSRGDSYCDL